MDLIVLYTPETHSKVQDTTSVKALKLEQITLQKLQTMIERFDCFLI